MDWNRFSEETQRVLTFIEDNKIKATVKIHDPVFTCQEAAEANSCTVHATLKALVLEDSKNDLALALLCGDQKLDFNKTAKILKTEKMHLADKGRIESVTGFHIGAIPPFGFCQLLPVLLDNNVLKNETVVFNAGDHSVSIHMKTEDLLKAIPGAQIVEITK